MVEKKSYIAFTVMTNRADGKPMFLVEHEQTDFIFPFAKYNKEITGLACAIEVVKEKLNIDFNCLELAELTNAVIKDQRIPFFVFKYHCESKNIDELISANTKLEWQASDNFKDTLQQYEISGVPLF